MSEKLFLMSWVMNVTKRLRLFVQRRSQRLTRIRSLGTPTHISGTARFYFPERLTIGEYVRIGPHNVLNAEGGISVESGVIFAPDVLVLSSSHSFQQNDCLPYGPDDHCDPVIIGAGSWIGWGAIILPGVTIGPGSVVGAGSVVTKNISTGSIVAGNPAKQIGKRTDENWINKSIESKNYYLKSVLNGATTRKRNHRDNSEVIWPEGR